MPKRVEEVRFRIERVRLKEGVSAPPLFALASKWCGLAGSGAEGGVHGSLGGVALVTFKSNGRRGVGCSKGGPSEDIFRGSVVCSSVDEAAGIPAYMQALGIIKFRQFADFP
jgi:hypothetical protein